MSPTIYRKAQEMIYRGEARSWAEACSKLAKRRKPRQQLPSVRTNIQRLPYRDD